MIPTSVTATPEHPGSHGSSENRRAWRLAASHRRRRRGARGFQNSRGIVCVRGEGGAGGGQELRGRSWRGRSSAGEPSGRAVFSVQPRNDKTQVFSFKTKKKKKSTSPRPPPFTTLATHNISQTQSSGAQASPTNMHTRDK